MASSPAGYEDITLGIVAGGRGSRLGGVRKSLLRVEGETIYDRQRALAARYAELLVSAGADASWRPAGARVVQDALPDRGAPGGVHALLCAARTPWVQVLGGDMPFVRAAALEVLQAARGAEVEVVCFEVGGRLEPLLGLYAASLARPWARLLVEQPSLQELARSARCLVLPERTLREVDPGLRSTVSLNTPEDLARWGAELPSG